MSAQHTPGPWRPLTKAQVKFLTRLMREERVPISGAAYRVAGTLAAQGRCELSENVAAPTAKGLHALYAYRARKWGDHGSMASLLDLEEVKAAIAAQFPGENPCGFKAGLVA